MGYVGGSPTNNRDPLGLYTWADVPIAVANYCSGISVDWNTTFGSINWGDAKSRITQQIASMTGGGACTNRQIPVNFVAESQTVGGDSKIIGRHNLKVQGMIHLKCDCSWSFSGNMSSEKGSEQFNANKSNRDASAEARTTILRNMCIGDPFKITITGSESLSFGSRASGQPTCCR